MSQDEKIGIEIVTTKIKIKIEKVIEYSKIKVPAHAKKNGGELVIKRNIEEMKKWSEDEISKIFDDQGNLKSFPSIKQLKLKNLHRRRKENDPGSRVDLIRRTKKLAAAALKLIFEDEKLSNSEFEIPNKIEINNMAKNLISEENIRSKFQKICIEYDRIRHY